MTAPSFTLLRLSSDISPSVHNSLTRLFPPDPVTWALERARECVRSGGALQPWPVRMTGLSSLGFALDAVYQWEIHNLTCATLPNPHQSRLNLHFLTAL